MAKTSGGVRTKTLQKPEPRLTFVQKARIKINRILADIKDTGFSRVKPFSIGNVEKEMRIFATNNGIRLGSSYIYMTPSSIAHAMRDAKKKVGLAVSDIELSSFPSNRTKLQNKITRRKNKSR